MKLIDQILQEGRNMNCSDIHLSVGLAPVFRKNGEILISKEAYPTENIVSAILEMLTPQQKEKIENKEDIDFSYTLQDDLRHRVNVYYQSGKLCAAIRILNDTIPTFDELNIPQAIRNLTNVPNGLILITGPTGSGKSTTLAAMINQLNKTRRGHIITLEDPIEYVHKHNQCLIHQREVGKDVHSFKDALKSAMREDPDIILVGEMRDLETISAAITAAETGHLVLSTLHTTGAANTVDRIIDVFPGGEKDMIRSQLASVLRGVVTQTLVPTLDGNGRVAAFEILLANDAVASLIRENKCFQINSVLQTGLQEGMCTLNGDLAKLVKRGIISFDQALNKATNKSELSRLLG